MAAGLEPPPSTATVLAHPIRWAILRTLSRTDLRVNELVAELGVAQNLVSYHLSILHKAGVVGERRSSADSRDIYQSLDLDALDRGFYVLESSLHPILGRRASVPTFASGSVLFLCTANSARSQIAEALLRHQTGGSVIAMSAGSKPNGIHDLTLCVLKERGIDGVGLESKHWSDLPSLRFDRVITLCDMIREELPEELRSSQIGHWSIADPTAAAGATKGRLAVFRTTADRIDARITALIAELSSAA